MEGYVPAAGLAVVILSAAVGITWRLSRVELSLRQEFTEENAKLAAKIYQVEIWARDEFVRKGSFEAVVSRLEKSMENLGSKMEVAVDKMVTRVEKISHEHAVRPLVK